jgi:hypothetical protein
MVEISVVMARGAGGAQDDDTPLEKLLRDFANLHGAKNEWSEKYGTDYEDDVVMMHTYCWCDEALCKWCGGDEPNFRYKPTGFEVTWYKYIGRDMKHRPISSEEVAEMRKKLF